MRIFIAVFFTFNMLGAQKVVKKSIINHEITAINIDAGNCYELMVDTTNSSEMVLEAIIDGEYKKDLLLNARRMGNTMLASTGFKPNFKNPNDKLSAHKVISIALNVRLPEHKSVTIYGTGCNVIAKGSYSNLKITLDNGQCVLDRVSDSVAVNTQSGDVIVYTSKADIRADSKYGAIIGDEIPKGDQRYTITTVTGEIRLNKTE